MQTDIRMKFLSAMEQFFESIPNGVRMSTTEHLNSLTDLAGEDDQNIMVTPDGSVAATVTAMATDGSQFNVFFGVSGSGSAALRLEIKARDMKTLAAFVDVASAGFCGIDGVSMVEGWAHQ